MKEHDKRADVFLSLARISLGFIFLWAFIDKLFGLGYATKPHQAWLVGGSPAGGFLTNATHGPLAAFYHGLAGNPVVDWLFMIGLLGLGVALILGIGLQIAAYAGTLMMLLMWSSLLPPQNNPIVDEHIVYAFLLLAFGWLETGRVIGLGNWWRETGLVKKYPVLQ